MARVVFGPEAWLAFLAFAPAVLAGSFSDSYTSSCNSGVATQSFTGTDLVVNGVVLQGTSTGIPAFGGSNNCALAGLPPNSFVSANATARTDVGIIGVSVGTETSVGFSTGFEEATASALYSGDFIFGGPQPTITTYMVLLFEGSIDFACNSGFGCTHEIDAHFELTDETVTFKTAGLYHQYLQSSLFTVATGKPISIGFRLDADARSVACQGLGLGCPDVEFSSVTFFDTLELNPDGPVFNLPEGYTVNGACVADNQFVCGASTATPEPFGALMLVGGLAGLYLIKGRGVRDRAQALHR